METIIIFILIGLVYVLGNICILQNAIIKSHYRDFDEAQNRVWKLQDKYGINDEDIRECFHFEDKQ